MTKRPTFKVGHHVVVDDSFNFYHKREVVITEVHDGFLSVALGNVTFTLRNIHAKYNEYQD